MKRKRFSDEQIIALIKELESGAKSGNLEASWCLRRHLLQLEV